MLLIGCIELPGSLWSLLEGSGSPGDQGALQERPGGSGGLETARDLPSALSLLLSLLGLSFGPPLHVLEVSPARMS